jgi:hypothetical protein
VASGGVSRALALPVGESLRHTTPDNRLPLVPAHGLSGELVISGGKRRRADCYALDECGTTKGLTRSQQVTNRPTPAHDWDG